MAEALHYNTAPEDRISFLQKFVYGLGSLCNQLLTAAMSVLLIVLNLGLGMDPFLVGVIAFIPRFIDALLDPVMGFITDMTKSSWGRRRPYIFVGAVLSGLVLMFMWQIPSGRTEHFYFGFFAIGSILFYVAYTIFAAPFVALGYEMTPDYHERTRLLSWSNTIGQFAWTITPWFYVIIWNRNLFPDVGQVKGMVSAAGSLAIWIGIFSMIIGVLPAIYIRERFYKIAKSEDSTDSTPKASTKSEIFSKFGSFFKGFTITLKNKEFLKLCAAMFLIFNGFQLIAGLAPYNIIYYCYSGNDQAASLFMSWFFTVSSLMTSFVIPIISWISTKIGKRNAFYVSTSISILGYAMKWFCYSKNHPYLLFLATPFIGFGLGGLFTLVGAMMADLCDQDELLNGHRREGMYGAVNWWIVKLGLALAFFFNGILLNITGFDVKVGWIQPDKTLLLMRLFEIGIPIVTSLIAMLAVANYGITEEKAHEIRSELEKRRGKVSA